MSAPRLSLEEQETLRLMAQSGVPPCDLATHFDVSISTVHNYKARLAKQGIQMPNVKGRHHGYRTPESEPASKLPVVMLGTFHGPSEETLSLPGDTTEPPAYMTINFNGHIIQVDKRAAGVRVDEKGQVHLLY